MGACQSTHNKKRTQRAIIHNNSNKDKQLVVDPEPMPIVPKIRTKDQFDNLRSHFKIQIKSTPFGNFSPLQEEQFEAEFVSSKFLSPYKYIETKNYPEIFTKLYEICFLKCEPLLGNITDDKKESNLLFFRVMLFLMGNVSYLKRKVDTAKKLLIDSYDHNQKKHNIELLEKMIKGTSELCIEIVIYMGLLSYYVKPEELIKVLSSDNYLLHGKYMKVELDDFFFDQLHKQIRIDSEAIKTKWVNFIMEPLSQKEDNTMHEQLISDFRGISMTTSQIKSYKDISDAVKEEILYRIVHMLDQNNFFDVLVGNPVPFFNVKLYNIKEA